MTLVEKVRAMFNQQGHGEKLQRLKDIDTREVSLVDHPAIDEPFIEVKSKDGILEKEPKEDNAMDESKVKGLIESAVQAALAPLAEGFKTLTNGLEEIKKAVAEGKVESGKAVEAVAAMQKDFTEFTTESVEVTTKVAGRVNEIVDKMNTARSNKIAGDVEAEGSKGDKPKWPSLSKLAIR